MQSQRFLSRTEAADYLQSLGLSTTRTSLQKLASVGGGPRFRRFGRRVLYTTEDLQAWVESRLSEPLESTSGHHS